MQIVTLLLIGLVIGGISGLLGIGGGVLMVPALMYFRNMEQSRASGTSLALLALPIALPAAWRYYQNSQLDGDSIIWLAVSFALGGYLGASVVPYVPQTFLRFFFGIMMMYIAMRFMLSADAQAAAAMAGVSAVSAAWTVFWLSRLLGQRILERPSLQAEIRQAYERRPPESDYSI